jgi:hypothetical protein
MIHDLTPAASSEPQQMACVRHSSLSLVQQGDLTQPIANIPEYLDTRRPVPHFDSERSLYITLRDSIREDLQALLGDAPGGGAFGYAASLTLCPVRASTSKACADAYLLFQRSLNISLKRFRGLFDTWIKTGDWVSLVNRAKAGPLWQKSSHGLSDEFLDFCASRLAGFRRYDAKRQAVFSIHRQWRTGRDPSGETRPIPGYGYWRDWYVSVGHKVLRLPKSPLPVEAPLPPGWSYGNICQQLKLQGKRRAAVTALINEGIAAAKEFLPSNLTSRADLRFLERVTFDDVRTDWLVVVDGQACELWLLLARDHATAMVLGFVMHTSQLRQDGSATHLGLREMKQLAAWILERYPLPPYTSHWVVERGTATLPPDVAAALQELLPSRIQLHYTSMIGGKSPVGYKEKAKGNSRGKASHESHNRLLHTQSSFLPGQTGAHYGIRPADLKARAEECAEVWQLRERLPEQLRGKEKYPLLLPAQAREHLVQFCIDQNFRTAHELEGFDDILEWYDTRTGKWMPQNTFPGPQACTDARFRTRKEMPVERAIKLMSQTGSAGWTKASSDIIITFLSHTTRRVTVQDNGEVKIRIDGRDYIFAPPPGISLAGVSSGIGYFHPDDPAFLHVSNGEGSILGTWFRRGRTGVNDHELISEAMRYTANALKAAQEVAASLTAEDRASLESMRAHNAELAADAGIDRGNEFVSIPSVPASASASELASPVATALATAATTRRTVKRESTETYQTLLED